MYTIYVVYEGLKWQDFSNGQRYNIGEYYTKTYDFHSLKEVLKFGAEFDEEVIDEIVFFNKEEADNYALRKTKDKLAEICMNLYCKDKEF